MVPMLIKECFSTPFRCPVQNQAHKEKSRYLVQILQNQPLIKAHMVLMDMPGLTQGMGVHPDCPLMSILDVTQGRLLGYPLVLPLAQLLA